MSHLLPLKPQGLGTADVEGLASYFARLSAHHCASTYQFANYLQKWSGIKASGWRALGKCAGRNSLLLNGFGIGAQTVVDWLNTGLERDDMAALTMLIFKDVLPLNGTGVLRLHRAWCPACFKEMQDQGIPTYEKLSWHLRLMTRCTFHQVRLETACPCCAREQLDYPGLGGDFALCRYCGTSLIGSPVSWQLASKPTAGEADLIEIVRRSTSAPAFRYEKESSKIFMREYLLRVTDQLAFRKALIRAGAQTCNFKKQKYQPTLNTLVGLSLITEVPLHLMLESPVDAAGIAQLEPTFASDVVPKPRALRTSGKRKAFKSALLRELHKEDGALPIPLKRLCRKFGIGVPTAEFWDHSKAGQLVVKYEKAISALREQRANTARLLIQEKGLPKYRTGEFKSQKEMIDSLRAESGISKGSLYRELSLQLHGAGIQISGTPK